MILIAIYQMLSTGEQWNPSDLYKIDMPVDFVEKQKATGYQANQETITERSILPPDESVAF